MALQDYYNFKLKDGFHVILYQNGIDICYIKLSEDEKSFTIESSWECAKKVDYAEEFAKNLIPINNLDRTLNFIKSKLEQLSQKSK